MITELNKVVGPSFTLVGEYKDCKSVYDCLQIKLDNTKEFDYKIKLAVTTYQP
jgi:hypothetical protein